MNNAVSMIVAFTILGLITWAPTVIAYRRRRKRGERVSIPPLITALLIEMTAVVIAVATVAGLGVPNPGGYLLAIALLVGAVGAQVFSRLGFK